MPRFMRLAALQVCLATLVGAVPASLTAQDGRVEYAGFDAVAGLAFGQGGGSWGATEGVGLSAVAAATVRRLGRGRVFVGLNGHASSTLVFGADCARGPDGLCQPDFPSVTAGGLLVGIALQRGDRGSALRASLGPVFARGAALGSGVGLQGRLDAATPSLGPVALVGFWHILSARLTDTSIWVPMMGLGLRIR